MRIVQALIDRFSFFGVGLILLTSAVLLSVVCILVARRLMPCQKLKGHNDITGAIFHALGVTYAVLLAFMVVVAWQKFEQVEVTVETEANYIADIVKNSVAFPKDFSDKVRGAAEDYVDKTIREWESLSRGEKSPETGEALDNLLYLYAEYTPRNLKEEIFFGESVRKLNLLSEMRRIRLFESKQRIPTMLWIVLIFGGVSTIAFTAFFGVENYKAQLFMSSLLSVLIALILYTVLSLDFPFAGEMKIVPDAFRQMIEY
jgi:hypothetical protein